MNNFSKVSKITAMVFGAAVLVGVGTSAWALPTSKELYRNDKIRLVIYEDRMDKSVFWYRPPVKLFEENGKVKFKKELDGDKYIYTFWVKPISPEEVIDIKTLAGEIDGLQNRQQLKSVTARSFGIIVPDFESGPGMSDKRITDLDYIDFEHPVKVKVPAQQVKNFETAINEVPGVQAFVLIQFDSERMDKDITVQASCKDVYKALNIAVTGRYQFAQAEIENAVSDYISRNNVQVSGKGDLPIPDIVKEAIRVCFAPVSRNYSKFYDPYQGSYPGGYPSPGSSWPPGTGMWNFSDRQSVVLASITPPLDQSRAAKQKSQNELDRLIKQYKELGVALPLEKPLQMQGIGAMDWGEPAGNSNAGNPQGKPAGTTPGGGNGGTNDIPPWEQPGNGPGGNPNGGGAGAYDPWDNGTNGGGIGFPPGPNSGGMPGASLPSTGGYNRPGKDRDGVLFQFRREQESSDKNFYYQHLRFSDSSTVVGLPIYLTTKPRAVAPADVKIEQLPKREYAIDYRHTAARPLSSGITVSSGEQYVITAAFSMMQYDLFFGNLLIPWQEKWPSPDGDLYFRISDGAWNKVGKRALIKTDSIQHGELEFYMDRAAIFQKIPEKKRGFLGPFHFDTVMPRFNVVVTGRKVIVK